MSVLRLRLVGGGTVLYISVFLLVLLVVSLIVGTSSLAGEAIFPLEDGPNEITWLIINSITGNINVGRRKLSSAQHISYNI